eukprot:CAMPEP_0197434410 /NCGR_PEP_ID=MMETSP1175-20131217/2149_1 /TAXON_ID=1003142 /ORGANISM="Triceratium dubium, Strain CCMP147" /LENGTH=360 /DNA_ID=CAMNT_0042963123 /DNA_START=54 /DNA_END=1137 /DNA_ORIENTATION=-
MTKHSLLTFSPSNEGAMQAGKGQDVSVTGAASAAPGADKTPKNSARKRKAEAVASPTPATSAAREKRSKFSLQYNPETEKSMTKEQISAWRKQQRKERNRASAAASREKIRGRIRELEGEVDDLTSKYAAALERIRELEQERDASSHHKPLHHDARATALPALVSAEDSPATSPQTTPPAMVPSEWALQGTSSSSQVYDNNENEIKLHELRPILDKHSRKTSLIRWFRFGTGCRRPSSWHRFLAFYNTRNQPLKQTLSAVEITGAVSSSSSNVTNSSTLALDYEPLDFRTTENLWIPAASSSPSSAERSSPSSDVCADAGVEASGGWDDSSDSEMEEFLLDAFSDFDAKEAQADVLQVCV